MPATEDSAYELGEEVSAQVKVRKPVGIVVSTRLERELADELILRADGEGKRLSQVLREAVVLYVARRSTAASVQSGFAQVSFGGPQQMQAIALVQNTTTTEAPPQLIPTSP
jgi:hypothetical protein